MAHDAKHKKSRKGGAAKMILIVLLILVLAAGGCLLAIRKEINGSASAGEPVSVSIQQGSGVAAIAQHLGISEGHLSHVFKKETNYTALGYLTQYRIHTARKLLRDCRYKVYEVAEMVGYRDVAYFGSTFKKLTGMSPSEYQDRCR